MQSLFNSNGTRIDSGESRIESNAARIDCSGAIFVLKVRTQAADRIFRLN